MSAVDPIWFLRVAQGLTFVVGAIIAFASLRAYARGRDPALLMLGVGFLLVAVASAVAGVLYETATHDLLTAWTVSASFELVGFVVILGSILRPGRMHAGSTGPPWPDPTGPPP